MAKVTKKLNVETTPGSNRIKVEWCRICNAVEVKFFVRRKRTGALKLVCVRCKEDGDQVLAYRTSRYNSDRRAFYARVKAARRIIEGAKTSRKAHGLQV